MINILDKPRDSSQYLFTTDTFRLKSRKILSSKHNNSIFNQGGNRQNINKKMRCIWQADKGYNLIQRDQKGAEALIVAYLTKDGNYRSLFKNNIKPHSFVASHVFAEQFKKHFDSDLINLALETPINKLRSLPFWNDLSKLIQDSDEWPSNQRYYYIGKKLMHALSYGMMGHRFVMSVLEESGGTVVIKKKEAEHYLSYLGKLFPEIAWYQRDTVEQAKKNKVLYNIFGFPYQITDYLSDDNVKELYAWRPQSSVATLTNIAFCEMQEYIETNKVKWHLLTSTHDSILIEAPEEETIDCANILKKFIEKEFTSPVDKEKFRMQSSLAIGKNWGPFSENNIEGLKEI